MDRILIADDEPKFRDYLRQVINWQEHGFEICADARNGQEALDLALEYKPQIALLDINMPLMDGVTLTEKLKEKFADMAIIFITGHSEFEYARKALRLGVEEYILKPFTEDELISSLIKVKMKLHKRRDEELQTKGDMFLLRERFLNLLISEEHTFNELEITRIFKRVGIDLCSNVFKVISIEIDQMYQLWTEASEISLWKFAVTNFLNDILGDERVHFTFNGPEGRIISVINFRNEEDAKKYDMEDYRRLCVLVNRYLRFSITVGIGKPASSYKEIRTSYLQSISALQQKLFAENEAVFVYEQYECKDGNVGFYEIELNDKLQAALRIQDIEEIIKVLEQIKAYLKENKISLDFTYTIVIGLVSICLANITEMGANIEDVLGKGFSPYTEIRNKDTLEAVFSWLIELYQLTTRFFSENRTTRAKTIVENVKDFIRMNFKDQDLSVESIAHNVYLDVSYIRKLFAKEIGSPIIDYITAFRMQKAKEIMMNSPNERLYEVSQMVGYNDYAYFSKCFKKHYGISPSEYVNNK